MTVSSRGATNMSLGGGRWLGPKTFRDVFPVCGQQYPLLDPVVRLSMLSVLVGFSNIWGFTNLAYTSVNNNL